MRVTVALLGIIACEAVIGGGRAKAGGVEYVGAGTQAVGRGGAVAARADDPMVLIYNPAGLVELQGSQLLFNANVNLMRACVDPIGYYGWSAYGGGRPSRFVDQDDPNHRLELQLGRPGMIGPNEEAYYKGALDTVCMDEHLTPVPEVGVTARLSDRFGIGIGMMFPSVTPQGSWGGKTGIIHGAGGLRPAATRYMMISSGNVGIFPTLGLGFKIADWLRIGGSFRWGMIHADNTSIAAAQVGTAPNNDQRVHVKATDWFIPEFTGSLHIVPVDAIDVVLGFHYQGDLDAPGEISITSGDYDLNGVARTKTNGILGVRQKFPWSTWVGVRYANRLAPRPQKNLASEPTLEPFATVHDAFQDELFDLELDVQYEMNARHKDVSIEYVPGQFAEFESTLGTVTMQAFPDPSMPVTVIQKRWKDQISARFGGSYNILPGVFGVSAGVHYETRGVDPSYMQIDYWPLSRVGLHGGVRVRVAKRVDLTFSYAHIFQETLVVGAPEHKSFQVIGMEYLETKSVQNIDKTVGVPSGMPLTPLEENPKPTSVDGQARLTQNFAKALPGTPPAIINAGRYRSDFDVFSMGVNLHF